MLCEGFVCGHRQFKVVAHSQEVAGEFQDGGRDVVQGSADRRDRRRLHRQHQVVWTRHHLLQHCQS